MLFYRKQFPRFVSHVIYKKHFTLLILTWRSQITTLIDHKDIYGLALHIHQGKRILYLSSARASKLYSMELDDRNNPIGSLKEEFSISGLGPRGDDKIRKIRFTSDGKMLD